ncbi:hypothetical protein Psi01_21060 [Planobispora siamensis]|uniref:Uncharacterized protein n=1 Tax=Planobispora siamensis TaxID=936338 RepID=A0A8J3SF61_9ACTN|nr:hypothetical protein Psi01_21060 [Planobispora siamensis]
MEWPDTTGASPSTSVTGVSAAAIVPGTSAPVPTADTTTTCLSQPVTPLTVRLRSPDSDVRGQHAQ